MSNTNIIEINKEMKKYASKDLGQNFLVDINTITKIVSLIKSESGERILEIGSGFGALSHKLIELNFESLILNDVDERSIEFLNNEFKDDARVSVLKASVLKLDVSDFTQIIGNLPYYITTKILEKILLEGVKCKNFVFMVQKELKERLFAAVSSEDYGPLNLLIQLRGQVSEEFSVGRNCFAPAPHVDSAVFKIELLNEIKGIEYNKNFYWIVKKMFLHRRKTIFNNLSIYIKNKIEAASILKEADIKPSSRPQNINVEQYMRLVTILKQKNVWHDIKEKN